MLANLVLYNPVAALNALQLTQLRKAILKLRWTGRRMKLTGCWCV